MKSLFDQTQIGNMKMKNRLIRAAVDNRQVVNDHDGKRLGSLHP
jgi:hypothetical protein